MLEKIRFILRLFSFNPHTNYSVLYFVGKAEFFLKGSLCLIPSSSVEIQIMARKVCLRCEGENIAGHCQQTFENKNFVDITQQCFALLPQVNFPANNSNFH